jgi:hypothetical protein
MVSDITALNLHDSIELTFFIAAIMGSLFFGIKTLFLLASAVVSVDMLDDMDSDYEIDHSDGNHEVVSHDNNSIQVLSLHSLAGFFMMFGWVGLACYKQLCFSAIIAILIGLTAGIVTMLCSAYLFLFSKKMHSSGTVFTSNQTVGKIATVYNRIPAHGVGKVQLDVNGITRELLAQSSHQTVIASFKKVRIVRALDKEIVLVEELL